MALALFATPARAQESPPPESPPPDADTPPPGYQDAPPQPGSEPVAQPDVTVPPAPGEVLAVPDAYRGEQEEEPAPTAAPGTNS